MTLKSVSARAAAISAGSPSDAKGRKSGPPKAGKSKSKSSSTSTVPKSGRARLASSEQARHDARIDELEVALVRERRVSVALREVGLALGTTMDLDQMLELILDKVTQALEADRATLYLLDEGKQELVSRIVQGDEVRSITLRVGDGIAGHVARSGRAVHVKDAYQDSRFNPEWDLLSGYRTRSILAVPMKNHLGRTIGVIQVLNKAGGGTFTTDDEALLAAIATQAAVTIDNSRLFLSVIQKNMQLLETKEQLEHRVRDLKLLFGLESAMARASSLEELFMAVLGEAMRSCDAKSAAVALRDPMSSQVTLHLVDGKQRKMRRFVLPQLTGLIGAAVDENEVIVTKDAASDPRTDRELDASVGFICSSALAVPLEGEEGVPMGAIALYNKRSPDGFSPEDRSLVQLVAANASTAIRLQLAREAREREDRLTTIGRLLSGVMHDLKTPLSVVSGYVRLLKNEANPSERESHAANILKQLDHIAAMQREVLEFARGERKVLVRRVYLAPFFEQLRDQLAPELTQSNVEFILELLDRGTARFDEGKMLRVIHNLARNAVDAMRAQGGGKFTVRVTREKDKADPKGPSTLVLYFSDTGPGIPKEIEHRLFESFVTSGKKGGTGLGLAIVKKIVEEHNGAVTVLSSEKADPKVPEAAPLSRRIIPSKGATFVVRLPQPAQET